jgi:hypothetical protein
VGQTAVFRRLPCPQTAPPYCPVPAVIVTFAAGLATPPTVTTTCCDPVAAPAGIVAGAFALAAFSVTDDGETRITGAFADYPE